MKNTNKNIYNEKNITEGKNELYNLIGSRIRLKRLELNMTERELAEKLSISMGDLKNIENGNQRFSVDFLAEIAMVLNINKMYLLTGVNNEILKEDIKILDNYIEFFKMVKSLSYKNRERLYGMLDNNFTPKIKTPSIKNCLKNK